MVAFCAFSYVTTLLTLNAHTQEGIQAFHPLHMNNLSAEEINRRTLQIAAAVKIPMK